jgi:septal ring factor EnvC (AmiA/AmiB activator)
VSPRRDAFRAGAAARLALACLLSLAGLVPVSRVVTDAVAQAPDSSEMEQRRQLEIVRRQAKENREAASRLKGRENQVMGQLRRTEKELNATRKRLVALTQRRSRLDSQLSMTRVDLQRNIESLSDQREKLRRRLRSLYKFGPARELEFLFSTQSFAQLMTRWDYLVMIGEQDRVLMEDVRARKELVETLERRLQGHLEEVQRTEKQTTGENQRLAVQRTQRQTTVRQIQTQREAFEAAAVELEKTARSIQSLLARLEEKRRAEASRAKQEGRQPVPYTGEFAKGQGALDWPLRGNIVGTFGPEKHPRFNTTIMNNGIDIEAGIGTAVHAVAKGRVDYTSEDYGTYGQMIIINHGDGYYTLYGHLSSISVATGQEVAPGQTIGQSGDTGSLKGPVLHFEIRKGSQALNPQSWLR